MSDTVNSTSVSRADDELCPECGRPRITPKDDDAFSTTTAAAKRKGGASQQPVSAVLKKLRHSDTSSASSGKFSIPWVDNYPVWVRIYDGLGWRGWVHGIVDKVYNHGDGTYKIRVVIKDEEVEWVVPRTINDYNFDPIPSHSADPKYKLSNYIMGRDECMDGLTDVERKLFRCLKYHTGSTIDDEQMAYEQDIIGKSLLDEDPNSTTSMRNLVHSLMVNQNVIDVVKIATGEKKCSAQFALAYFIGQMCGIELSESTVSKEDIDPKGLLDQIGSNDNVDCPISQTFLLSAMSARTHKTKVFDPNGQLYDHRRKNIFLDPEKLKARMSKLRTALAAIHSSQSDQPPVSGPAFALLAHGIRLMIDMRGTSDRLLDRLAEEGICRPARVLRVWIQKLAKAVDPVNPRSPPLPGQSHVLCWTFDNADYHLFHRVVSVIPVGNVLLGIESEDETNYLNANFMKGPLGKISEVAAEDLIATEEEDKIAQDVIDTQNALAILTAAVDYNLISTTSASNRSARVARPVEGSDVSFTYRSEIFKGKVKSAEGKNVTMKFLDGDEMAERTVPI